MARSLIEDGEKISLKVDFTKLDGSSILITGASGIVGANMLACLAFLAQSGRYTGKLTAVMQSKPPAWLEAIIGTSGGRVLRGDLAGPEFMQSLPQADYIVHAAGYGQPGRFMEDPVKTMEINTSSTLHPLPKALSGRKTSFCKHQRGLQRFAEHPLQGDGYRDYHADAPQGLLYRSETLR